MIRFCSITFIGCATRKAVFFGTSPSNKTCYGQDCVSPTFFNTLGHSGFLWKKFPNPASSLQIKGQIPEIDRTVMSAAYKETVVLREGKALDISRVSPEGCDMSTTRHLP